MSLLVLWAGTDFTLRLLPLDWLHLLPEHIASRRPGRFRPFIPNLSIVLDPWIGETAMTGNLAPSEFRPPIRFSTDSLGFRKTPGVPPGGPIDLLLFTGRSYAYGGGLSDDETFPAALTRVTGLKTYNGGRFYRDPENLQSLDWLLQALHRPRPGILLLYWEDFDLYLHELDRLPWPSDGPGEALLGASRYSALRAGLQYAKRRAVAWWTVSPLEILSIRAFKFLTGGRILPNPYRSNVAVRHLPDGRRLLLLQQEVDRVLHPPDPADIRRHGDYFASLSSGLARRGLRSYVVLVPNRYSVYGPLIDGAAADPRPHYLDRLEADLRSRGIRVVNALPLLRSTAVQDLASGDLSYYREDHHWTPLGVERIARVAAARIRSQSPSEETTRAVQ